MTASRDDDAVSIAANPVTGSNDSLIADMPPSPKAIKDDNDEVLQRKLKTLHGYNGAAVDEQSAGQRRWHRWLRGTPEGKQHQKARRLAEMPVTTASWLGDKQHSALLRRLDENRGVPMLDGDGEVQKRQEVRMLVSKSLRKRQDGRAPQCETTAQDSNNDNVTDAEAMGVIPQDYADVPEASRDGVEQQTDNVPPSPVPSVASYFDLGLLNQMPLANGSVDTLDTYSADGSVVNHSGRTSPANEWHGEAVDKLNPITRKQSRQSQTDVQSSPIALNDMNMSLLRVPTERDDASTSAAVATRQPTRSSSILPNGKRLTRLLTNRGSAAGDSVQRRNTRPKKVRMQFGNRYKRKKATAINAEEEAVFDEEALREQLEELGLLEADHTEAYATDRIWENQRGYRIFSPSYSNRALLPTDAAAWTTMDDQPSKYNIFNYPLPTAAWKWHHSEWLVDMAHDVDAQGWQYSTRFGSKYWRGVQSVRFFVRRRMWLRTRYRAPFVGLKAETHPPPRLISPASASASPICNQLSAVPAWKLDPRNPFISWYDRSGRSRTSNGASVDSVKPKSGPKTDIPRFKDDLLHVNYVRAAKILVRRSQVDRERLTWWEYWLGTRECAPPQSYESESIVEKVSSEHPDVRDVWDLLEKRLDDLLLLFEYQSSRRDLLLLLIDLHNSRGGHASHRYARMSSDTIAPSELQPGHEHGSPMEMGGQPKDAPEPWAVLGQYLPRLEFWQDVKARLQELKSERDGVDVADSQGILTDVPEDVGRDRAAGP